MSDKHHLHRESKGIHTKRHEIRDSVLPIPNEFMQHSAEKRSRLGHIESNTASESLLSQHASLKSRASQQQQIKKRSHFEQKRRHCKGWKEKKTLALLLLIRNWRSEMYLVQLQLELFSR